MSKKGILKQLTGAVSQQEAWQTWLAAQLPEPLAAHINSVIARGSELVVFADSAAWSERLRYALAPLQGRITGRAPEILQTRVRVQPRKS
ncbi:MAG: DciA family protein [Steroidobacteraceae bacterium]